MRKIVEKTIIIGIAVFATFFTIMTLLLIFIPDIADESNNLVVKVLFIIIATLFWGLLAAAIAFVFIDNEKTNKVLMERVANTSKKVSVSVIKNLVRLALRDLDYVRICGIKVRTNEKSEIFLAFNLKILLSSSSTAPLPRVSFVMEKVSLSVAEEIKEVLDLEFDEIEVKLKGAKNISTLERAGLGRLTRKSKAENKEVFEKIARAASGEIEDIPIEELTLKSTQNIEPVAEENEIVYIVEDESKEEAAWLEEEKPEATVEKHAPIRKQKLEFEEFAPPPRRRAGERQIEERKDIVEVEEEKAEVADEVVEERLAEQPTTTSEQVSEVVEESSDESETIITIIEDDTEDLAPQGLFAALESQEKLRTLREEERKKEEEEERERLEAEKQLEKEKKALEKEAPKGAISLEDLLKPKS